MGSIAHSGGEAGLRRAVDFVAELESATTLAGDLQILASAPGFDPALDLRVQEDERGEVAGFGLVGARAGRLELEVRPGAAAAGLAARIVRWGLRRFGQVAREAGAPVVVAASVREGDDERAALLERAGFAAGDSRHVHLVRALDEPIPAAAVPDGFRLTTLGDGAALDAYVAAHREVFWLDALTVEWRTRMRGMPEYAPDLDLVVEAPGGEVAAFALGWGAPGRARCQIEPVGTRPAFQRFGLARALMLELFRRMRARGARQATGTAADLNADALALYASIGIVPTHHIRTYARDVAPGAAGPAVRPADVADW